MSEAVELYKTIDGKIYVLEEYALKRVKAMKTALQGVNKLFTDPSPFYIAKLGGSITNGDQTKIDNTFIAVDAALKEAQ